MQTTSPQELAAKVDARYRTFVFLWVGMFMSIILLLTLAVAIPSTATPNPTLSYSLVAIAVTVAIVSLLLRQRMVQQAISKKNIESLQSAQIVGMALCEAAALLGLLNHFVTGSNLSWVGLTAGVVGLFLSFPNKEHVRAVS